MDPKQAAAIARRKRELAADRDREFQLRKTGNLMDFQDHEPVKDQVGWMDPLPGSVKGQNHHCIECQRSKPDWLAVAVTRNLLAARQPCTICGRPLESIRPKEK